MKLEDCLGMHLQTWISGCLYMYQDGDGSIRDDSGLFVMYRQLCDDWQTAKVHEAQYLAARDRLHAATVKDMKAQPTPKNAEWLEIAKDQFHIITKSKTCRETLSFAQAAEFAFDAADAFCAEMSKRI